MRISDNIRAQRLDRIDQLLQRYPDGLREIEIARLLNFGRRTTNNYLRELEMHGRVYRDEQLWFPLPHQNMVLRRLDLQPEEAMTLYLALRLFVKQSDQRNEAAETTLTRLAEILKDDMGLGEDILAAAQELAHRPTTPGYESTFRTIMRGYIYRRKVDIVYHPYRGNPFNTVLSSYLLEPSAIGFATYVIGHSSVVNALRTFKLERIVQAQLLLHEDYTIPSDFPGLALLRTAWSIYHGDKLQEVTLRFDSSVNRRVRETNWHPSQILLDDPQQPDHLIMKLQVPDFTDLIPWIRSWGASCEVLEPASLRRTISKEIQHLAALYTSGAARPETPLAALWAKTDRETGGIHLLIYHLIDVAQVALALWVNGLNTSIRRQVCGWMNMDEDSAGRLVAFWVGLHDIGKACPAFQRKYPPAESLLNRVGLTISANAISSVPHGKVTARVLPTLLSGQTGESSDRRGTLAHKIACALGGHHGTWPSPQELLSVTDFSESVLGDHMWEQAREDLWNALRGVIAPPSEVQINLDQSSQNSLLVLLSGLTSVADWIGSMEEFFPYEEQLGDLGAYAAVAAEQAHEALHRLGWDGWSSTGDLRSFSELFPQIPSANSIQRAVIEAADQCELPALAILEAPTGIGKTEAALYLADNWLQRAFGRGLYVAMPTQATSNQMFDRVMTFLEHRFPNDLVNFHLLHGQAQWVEKAQQIRVHQIADDEQQTVAAMSWFLPRKRSLLAPFAVGTVDQVLMSILLTKHFFVRLFGLSHKVIIFDEVHAYDTYMSVLFHRLLAWLKQLGVSVIILSATLPEQTRRELLASYGGEQARLEDGSDSYPRLTLCDPRGIRTLALPAPQRRIISVEWIPRIPDEIATCLSDELKNGGCAVVVCNTVARAQEIFRAVQEAGIVFPDELVLFHARFPSMWRQEIEAKVLGAFGKDGNRPTRMILIATQVVEQSLDLDFDLMITDPAPIDLVLQRAGRLHRHHRAARPSNLEQPRLLVTVPDMDGLVPTFGTDKYVYEEFILLASTLLLQELDEIILPADTRYLIEAVYDDSPGWIDVLPEPLPTLLHNTKNQMLASFRSDEQKAYQCIVRSPVDERLLSQQNLNLEEDNPDINPKLQAVTRLIDPGVSVVCLHQTPRGVVVEPDSIVALDPEGVLTPELEKQLLQCVVTIRHRGVVTAMTKLIPPDSWTASPALRYHRLAIFTDGEYHVPGTPFVLRLTRELGLEIVKA